MKHFIFLTNIPTPYRTAFYNTLAEKNFTFEVYYMRHIEADRNWEIDLSKLKHRFYIDKGYYSMIGRFHVHFNPTLIRKIMRNRSAEIIIGGGWNDPDVLFLVTLKRLGILKNVLHFWSEANYLTIGASNDNFIKKALRKYVYNCSRGAQLSSGKMTEITLRKWECKVAGYVPLPNTIEEKKFTINAKDIFARADNKLPVFLMPVRLNEEIKGIINFFISIGASNVKRAIFWVAGEGPDKKMIQEFIQNEGFEDHIILLGHRNTAEMVELYRRANAFVLPSFSDPSPLSAIEALRMQLPVLLSGRCGNHFEVVDASRNGFVFDPTVPETARVAFEAIMDKKMEWREMGNISQRIYETMFQEDLVIDRFIKEIESFSDKQTGK